MGLKHHLSTCTEPTRAVANAIKMKKVILKKRFTERGEEENQSSSDKKREKVENKPKSNTENEDKADIDVEMYEDDEEAMNLVVSESKEAENHQESEKGVSAKGIMRKIILEKRLPERREEGSQITSDQKREKVENEPESITNKDDIADIDVDKYEDEAEAMNLVIDESREAEKGVDKKERVRNSPTMFTGVPENMITRKVRQVVPCKENDDRRYVGKKVGFSRAQLHEKRKGTYKKEHREYIRALEKVDRDSQEEERDFNYISAKNEGINQTNASTRGRLLVSMAARIKEIGDYIDDVDVANENQDVKITMVGFTETRTYVVDQGQHNQPGQEILTVFTREEIQRKEEDQRASSGPVAGCSFWRPS